MCCVMDLLATKRSATCESREEGREGVGAGRAGASLPSRPTSLPHPVSYLAHKHAHRVGRHKLGGNRLDLARPRRGEEERLPRRRDLAHDALNLGLKPHVEHAVGFVQDEVRGLGEAGLAALEEIVEAAGGRDDQVHPVAQVAQLGPLGRAAVRARVAETAGATEFVGLFLDLHRELARRREHAHRRPRARVFARRRAVHEAGQQEAARLAGPGFGDGDEVGAAQRDGPRLGLNGGGLRVARLADLLREGRRWRVGRGRATACAATATAAEGADGAQSAARPASKPARPWNGRTTGRAHTHTRGRMEEGGRRSTGKAGRGRGAGARRAPRASTPPHGRPFAPRARKARRTLPPRRRRSPPLRPRPPPRSALARGKSARRWGGEVGGGRGRATPRHGPPLAHAASKQVGGARAAAGKQGLARASARRGPSVRPLLVRVRAPARRPAPGPARGRAPQNARPPPAVRDPPRAPPPPPDPPPPPNTHLAHDLLGEPRGFKRLQRVGHLPAAGDDRQVVPLAVRVGRLRETVGRAELVVAGRAGAAAGRARGRGRAAVGLGRGGGGEPRRRPGVDGGSAGARAAGARRPRPAGAGRPRRPRPQCGPRAGAGRAPRPPRRAPPRRSARGPPPDRAPAPPSPPHTHPTARGPLVGGRVGPRVPVVAQARVGVDDALPAGGEGRVGLLAGGHGVRWGGAGRAAGVRAAGGRVWGGVWAVPGRRPPQSAAGGRAAPAAAASEDHMASIARTGLQS